MQPAQDFVERTTPIWHAIFFGTLAVCTLIACVPERAWDATQWVTLTVAALFALWYFLFLVRGNLARRRVPVMLGYIAGATGFTFVLVNLHPAYWLMLFSLFGQSFLVLPLWWAIAASGGISIVAAWQAFLRNGWTLENTLAALVFASASLGFAAFFGWFIDRILQESAQRQQLIEQLNATRAQLAQREREAGILQERQRLAREIHDTLAQGFSGIVMQLEAAEQVLGSNPTAAQKFLDTARQTARDNLEQARRVVADLRPELLERDSLPDAICRTAERWQNETGIAAHINVTGERIALAPDIEITLLRATQEALNNVTKHAHAQRVEISLAYMGDTVTLDIQDDGAGMSENTNGTHAAGGFGLIAMRERAEALGGRVTLESAPGEGTTIAVELPVRAA